MNCWAKENKYHRCWTVYDPVSKPSSKCDLTVFCLIVKCSYQLIKSNWARHSSFDCLALHSPIAGTFIQSCDSPQHSVPKYGWKITCNKIPCHSWKIQFLGFYFWPMASESLQWNPGMDILAFKCTQAKVGGVWVLLLRSWLKPIPREVCVQFHILHPWQHY